MPKRPLPGEPLSTGFRPSGGAGRGPPSASPSGVAPAPTFDYQPASGLRSLRLEAQDAALSRLKHGFESRRERQSFHRPHRRRHRVPRRLHAGRRQGVARVHGDDHRRSARYRLRPSDRDGGRGAIRHEYGTVTLTADGELRGSVLTVLEVKKSTSRRPSAKRSVPRAKPRHGQRA